MALLPPEQLNDTSWVISELSNEIKVFQNALTQELITPMQKAKQTMTTMQNFSDAHLSIDNIRNKTIREAIAEYQMAQIDAQTLQQKIIEANLQHSKQIDALRVKREADRTEMQAEFTMPSPEKKSKPERKQRPPVDRTDVRMHIQKTIAEIYGVQLVRLKESHHVQHLDAVQDTYIVQMRA